MPSTPKPNPLLTREKFNSAHQLLRQGRKLADYLPWSLRGLIELN